MRDAVEHNGFRVFAIEAGFVEAEAVNQYVLTGVGDATQVVKGLNLWPWQTEEVVAVTQWIRGWNVAHPDSAVTFYGFDCQSPGPGARSLVAYLRNVEPAALERHQHLLAMLGEDNPTKLVSSASSLRSIHHELNALSGLFAARKQEWVEVAGLQQWLRQQRTVRVIAQATELLHASVGGITNDYNLKRDAFMAENVNWIVCDESRRALIWAHNGHVARQVGKMGDHLAARHGTEYVVVGFAFGQGRFRARRRLKLPVTEITATARGAGEFDYSLSQLREPLFALDLRKGPVALKRPMTMREFGAVHVPWPRTRNVFAEFDFLIFVRDTTPSRPLRPAQRSPRPPA